AEAEDVVSETFVRIVTRSHAIASTTARAYLLTVARNVYLDTARRKHRDARLADEIELDFADLRCEPDQPTRLDNNTRMAAALKALGLLPEGERAAFLLRVDHDLSYEEIALALGISVAAAKVRVHRARLRLASASKVGGTDDES